MSSSHSPVLNRSILLPLMVPNAHCLVSRSDMHLDVLCVIPIPQLSYSDALVAVQALVQMSSQPHDLVEEWCGPIGM